MDDFYDDQDLQDFNTGTPVDEAVGTAAKVFKDLLEEMGIDPLDRHDWLGRFIEHHRSHLSRNENMAKLKAF
jgi:hypothetical protein